MIDYLPNLSDFFSNAIDFVKSLSFFQFITDFVYDLPLSSWFFIIFVIALAFGVVKLIIDII